MAISNTFILSMRDIGSNGYYTQYNYDTELVGIDCYTTIVILDTVLHAYLSYAYNRYTDIN